MVICLHNKNIGSSVGSLIADHLLLRNFGPYVIIFMNACVGITVAMVMLLKDFGPHCFHLCFGLLLII
jgi:hypothetical protein